MQPLFFIFATIFSIKCCKFRIQLHEDWTIHHPIWCLVVDCVESAVKPTIHPSYSVTDRRQAKNVNKNIYKTASTQRVASWSEHG